MGALTAVVNKRQLKVNKQHSPVLQLYPRIVEIQGEALFFFVIPYNQRGHRL